MSYKGRYTPTKPQKYKGDSRNIVYRSLWERKFMVYCDTSSAVIEPKDGRMHRYFPDFYIKVKQADGQIKKMIIEVKPKVQCKPPKEPKRKNRRWMNAVMTYGVNDAKWRYATDWCANNGMEFKILTEDHLGISYK